MKTLVLLSSYNGERFLREQLDSLLAQTIDADILVRDDGSTDGTIAELAYACGFSDASYFNRCFRKEYGKTPSEHAGK